MIIATIVSILVVVSSLFSVNPQAVAERFEGKVLAVSEDFHLTIKHLDTQQTFLVNDATRFMLDGQEAKWKDIQPGFAVTIEAERDGAEFVARSVVARSN